MPVMPDSWIIKMADENAMIEPFAEKSVRNGVISYGVSSYGYDFRVADEFKIPRHTGVVAVDPKAFDMDVYDDYKGDSIVIQPQSFVIARTLEYFRIPRDILALCTGKSTYSRIGIVVNFSPFEPEWEGYATFTLANLSSLPVRVYANEGIGQIIFLKAVEVCEISYKDKKGKYQNQQGIAGSKVE
jgi:dCTP deaminase